MGYVVARLHEVTGTGDVAEGGRWLQCTNTEVFSRLGVNHRMSSVDRPECGTILALSEDLLRGALMISSTCRLHDLRCRKQSSAPRKA